MLLKARGFDMPEGSSAFFDASAAQVFLRSTQRDLNHLERLLDEKALVQGLNAYGVKQVKVTAVCQAIPFSAVPADFGPSSSLQSLPQDKLTVIDRTTFICRSGQRSKVENHRDKQAKPPVDPASVHPPPQEAERYFEIEITVGEDGTTIDLNMAWELRTTRLAPEAVHRARGADGIRGAGPRGTAARGLPCAAGGGRSLPQQRAGGIRSLRCMAGRHFPAICPAHTLRSWRRCRAAPVRSVL